MSFIEEIKATLPELPDAIKHRFMNDLGLPAYDAEVLCSERELADYFEAVVKTASADQAKTCANWVMGELLGALNKEGKSITVCPVSPEQLGGMVKRIADGTVSGKIAKQIFEAMWNGEGDADAIIEAKGLKQVSDTGFIDKLIDEVMAENPGQLADYRAGKDKLFGFFVGQAMKKSQGKANPQQLNELLQKKLAG